MGAKIFRFKNPMLSVNSHTQNVQPIYYYNSLLTFNNPAKKANCVKDHEIMLFNKKRSHKW